LPELPEVETVRDGLQRWVVGHRITGVEIRHPRSVRRHIGGGDDLAARLLGARFVGARRRGKFLWLPLDADEPGSSALVAHLGMSGQLLVQPHGAEDEKHLHVRIVLDDGNELRFVDQRTFGGVFLDDLVPTDDLVSADETMRQDEAAELIASSVAHIARDPLDPSFDDAEFITRLRRKSSAVKRCLLDQTLISGVGNIYADEALWRARIHGERLAARLSRSDAAQVLAQVREVLVEAIRAGGTSFDALYVNVNGQSGYFERSLNVYGREGQACRRCGTAIRRSAFMNRSSYFCPVCQPVPRVRAASRSPR
jgi:formamidopyrimidine-DNA glycosylase